MTRLVADVGCRNQTPSGIVKTPLLVDGEIGETVRGDTELRKCLIEQRISEIGGKGSEA